MNLILWPSGRGRLAWAIIAGLSASALACVGIWGEAFSHYFTRFSNGGVLWALSIAFLAVLTVTVWARSIGTAERRGRWPKFLTTPVAVCALGMFFPGLGLLITGRRWKAGFALWCAGLLAAAVVVLRQWRWVVANAPAQSAGEVTLVIAVGCAMIGITMWIALAFDAVRAVSPTSRSGHTANALAVSLLVALLLFQAAFRPGAVARTLEDTAIELRSAKLRIIPLALYETAGMLDPARPIYAAKAAALYDELGMSDEAGETRERLQARAAEFAGAVGAELTPAGKRNASVSVKRPLDVSDHITPLNRNR